MANLFIIVTWDETYKAEMGDCRFVNKSERKFRRQLDADQFLVYLKSTDAIEFSLVAGRENKIENVKVSSCQVPFFEKV